MDGFAIEDISLETQKRVVIEEKKQTTDDAPYGDMSILMRALSYDPSHPYSWDTIGATEDVEAATMQDVRSFYDAYYHPANVTLVVAGDFDREEGGELISAYFGAIPAGPAVVTPAPAERLLRTGGEHRQYSSIIPFNAVFLGYHTPSLHHRDSYAMELLAAILSDGESSRLYRSLEYTQEIASECECFLDEGELGSMFYLYAVGQNARITPARLREALLAEVETIARDGVTERELQKVKNQKLTRIARALQSVSTRAERLAWFTAMFDDPSLAFREADLYAPVTVDDIRDVARRYLGTAAPNVIEYHRKNG
jgi:predicted Zn-dependent peptidase